MYPLELTFYDVPVRREMQFNSIFAMHKETDNIRHFSSLQSMKLTPILTYTYTAA